MLKKDTHKVSLKGQEIAMHDKWYVWCAVVVVIYAVAAIM